MVTLLILALCAQPSVIYPIGTGHGAIHIARAVDYERTATGLKAAAARGKVLMETGDSTKITAAYKKYLNAKARLLLKQAKASRDSAKTINP